MHLGPHRRRFNATDDDVFCPQTLDRFLGIMTSAFTDRHERDYRPDPDNHSKHGEHATKLVQSQTFESDLYDANEEKSVHYTMRA